MASSETYMETLKRQAYVLFTEKLRPGTPDFGMVFYMVFAYWALAGFYDILDHLPFTFIQKYKVVRKEVGFGNQITRLNVVLRVLLQQAIQTLLAVGLMIVDPDMCKAGRAPESLLQRGVRFVLGMFIMDTYQFWVHRYLHVNKFLYKHLHSWHHSLVIPYAYGALYNSILEGLILDSLGGAITHYGSGLDCTTASYLMTFATCKTVLDHCNFRFPLNPLHNLFPNSSAYHDVHHDARFISRNLSQPFFTHWDWLMGTFTDPTPIHLTVKELDIKLHQQQGQPHKPQGAVSRINSLRNGSVRSSKNASGRGLGANGTAANGSANGTHGSPKKQQ